MPRTIAIALPTFAALIILAIPAFAETIGTNTVYIPLSMKPDALTVVPTPIPEKCPAVDRVKELEMMRLLNGERAKAGLPALVEDANLTVAARCHAIDMVAHDFLSHTGSDGSTVAQRVEEAGYAGIFWAENAGVGFGGDAQSMVNWWMGSSMHRSSILSPDVTELGVGYGYDSTGQWQQGWTVDLGRR